MSEYQFGPAEAELIANALGQTALGKANGRRLKTDWVEISKSEWAGERIVTVVQEDVMAKIRPYVDDPSWTSIKDPMLFGNRLTGEKYYHPLTQHDQYIGKTMSGKSSLIQLLIAYVTRCADAQLWIGGVGKLYDLVGEWCECYMGSEFPIPIDWVATGPQDTLEMMAAVMRIATYRQSVPVAMQQDWPTLIVVFDEVTDIAEDDEHFVVFEGRRMFGTDMLAKQIRRVGSSNIFLKKSTQRGTNDMFGDKGGAITAQFGLTAAFMTQDTGDLGRLMNDNYKLPMPRHKGECWLKPDNGDLPLKLKVPYLQPASRSKKRLHDGITIPDVAWSRRHFRSTLDPGSIEAAGEPYARRHTHMTPAFQNYLRGIENTSGGSVATTPPRSASPPLSGSEPDSAPDADDAMAEALALARSLGVELPDDLVSERDRLLDGSPAPQPDGDVVSMVGRQHLGDHIVVVLSRSDRPRTRGEIIADLEADGREVRNPQLVTNELTKLVRMSRVDRTDLGYSVTEGSHTHKHTHDPARGV